MSPQRSPKEEENGGPCDQIGLGEYIDYAVPSKLRTLNLMKLNLLAYPSCERRRTHGFGCGYPIATMEDIFLNNRSIFGSDIATQEQENAASDQLHEKCREWLTHQNDTSYTRVSVPEETAEFEFGVEAFEFVTTTATILIFRGTFTEGDYANIENWMIDYILEKSTDRMKEAWVEDAGLPWTAEMQQRGSDDRFQKLLIRAGESFILHQNRPLKDEGSSKESLAEELSDAVRNDPNLSQAINGMTIEEAKSTGYWKLTKYIVDHVATRAAERNHTLLLTGHSQGGTRAQLGSMYLHQKTGEEHPTITFSATGSACVARLLFDSDANLLDDVNPFVKHDHMVDYVHPLDPWGNAMLGEDNGLACFWGKDAVQESFELGTTNSLVPNSAFQYCKRVYGYSAPLLIASDSGLNGLTELKSDFQRCRYFTHTAEAVLYGLHSELLGDGNTTSGCKSVPVILQDDPDQRCPVGSISLEEEEAALSVIFIAVVVILLCLFGVCCSFKKCWARCCPSTSRITHSAIRSSIPPICPAAHAEPRRTRRLRVDELLWVLFLFIYEHFIGQSQVAGFSACDLGGATDLVCVASLRQNESFIESDSFPTLMNQSNHSSEEEKQAQLVAEANELLNISDWTAFSPELWEGSIGNLPVFPSTAITSCFNGTSVKLEALDLNSDLEMRRQIPYTFRVNVEVDIDEITGDSIPETAALYFRFFLCNAIEIHFCNTHVISPLNESVILIEEHVNADVVVGLTDYRNNSVVSPWMMAYETVSGNTTRLSIKDLDVKFGLSLSTPLGFYRLMFHSMLMLLDDTSASGDNNISTTLLRVDTTGVGSPTILEADSETEILTMTEGVEILIYVMIAICDCVALATLAYLIKYRNHAAIRLAQGEFLVGLVVASIVSSTFVFTIMPNEDWYCAARGPLLQIPFTFIAAILVARLWRVYIALSGAMKLGRPSKRRGSAETGTSSHDRSSSRMSRGFFDVGRLHLSRRLVETLTFIAKFQLIPKQLCQKCTRIEGSSGSVFRRKASSRETWQLVVILCLPQTALQLTGVFMYKPELELQTDSSGSVGRFFCSSEWRSLQIGGILLTLAMFMLAVTLAWQGRHLPSVFNEKTAIFNTAAVLALILMITIVVIEVADSVSTSPDSSVFIRCILMLSGAMLVLYNLVWPKLRRAVSGETIVVGNLLREYGGVSKKDTEATADARRPTFLAGAPILVHKNDPLPHLIERDVHKLHELLQVVVHKCGYGKALTRGEWDRMIRNVSKLKIELDRVQLDFEDEAQTGVRGESSDGEEEDGAAANGAEDAAAALNQEQDIAPNFASLVDSTKKSTTSSDPRSVRFSEALVYDSKDTIGGESLNKNTHSALDTEHH